MPVAQEQGGSAINDLRGIARLLLDDNYNFEEQDQMAAEQALGGGFGRARRGLMRDSERKARWAQATPILQGIAGMAQQAGLQTQSEKAALQRDVENARQAMERQNAAMRGQLVAQTQSEAAADRQAILRGQQAMQQLELQGAQADRRQAAGFSANIEDREDTQTFNAGESAAERAFRLQQQYVGGTAGRNSYTGPSAPVTKTTSPLDSITNPTDTFLNDYMRKFSNIFSVGADGRGAMNLPPPATAATTGLRDRVSGGLDPYDLGVNNQGSWTGSGPVGSVELPGEGTGEGWAMGTGPGASLWQDAGPGILGTSDPYDLGFGAIIPQRTYSDSDLLSLLGGGG